MGSEDLRHSTTTKFLGGIHIAQCTPPTTERNTLKFHTDITDTEDYGPAGGYPNLAPALRDL